MVDVSALVHQMHETLSTIQETIASLSTAEHDAKLDALEVERNSTVEALLSSFKAKSEELTRKRQAERDEIVRRRRAEDEEREARRRKEDEELAARDENEDLERQHKLDGEREDVEDRTDGMMDQVEEDARAKLEAGRQRLAELEERRKEINRLIDEQLSTPLPAGPVRRRARAQLNGVGNAVPATASKTNEPVSTKAKEQPSSSTLGPIEVPSQPEDGDIVQDGSAGLVVDSLSDNIPLTKENPDEHGAKIETETSQKNEEIITQQIQSAEFHHNSELGIPERGSGEGETTPTSVLDTTTLLPPESVPVPAIDHYEPAIAEASADYMGAQNPTDERRTDIIDTDNGQTTDDRSRTLDHGSISEHIEEPRSRSSLVDDNATLGGLENSTGVKSDGQEVDEEREMAHGATREEEMTPLEAAPATEAQGLEEDTPSNEHPQPQQDEDELNDAKCEQRDAGDVELAHPSLDESGGNYVSSDPVSITPSEAKDPERQSIAGNMEKEQASSYTKEPSGSGQGDITLLSDGKQCIPGTMTHGVDMPETTSIRNEEEAPTHALASQVTPESAEAPEMLVHSLDETGPQAQEQLAETTVSSDPTEPVLDTSQVSTPTCEPVSNQDPPPSQRDLVLTDKTTSQNLPSHENGTIVAIASDIQKDGPADTAPDSTPLVEEDLDAPTNTHSQEDEGARYDAVDDQSLTEPVEENHAQIESHDMMLPREHDLVEEREIAPSERLIDRQDANAPSEAGGNSGTGESHKDNTTEDTGDCDEVGEGHAGASQVKDDPQIIEPTQEQIPRVVPEEIAIPDNTISETGPPMEAPRLSGDLRIKTGGEDSFRVEDSFPEGDAGLQQVRSADTASNADVESYINGTSKFHNDNEPFSGGRDKSSIHSGLEVLEDGRTDQASAVEENHDTHGDENDSDATNSADQTNQITLGAIELDQGPGHEVNPSDEAAGELKSAETAAVMNENASALGVEDFRNHLQPDLSPLNTATVHGQDDLFEDDSDNISEYSDAPMERSSDSSKLAEKEGLNTNRDDEDSADRPQLTATTAQSPWQSSSALEDSAATMNTSHSSDEQGDPEVLKGDGHDSTKEDDLMGERSHTDDQNQMDDQQYQPNEQQDSSPPPEPEHHLPAVAGKGLAYSRHNPQRPQTPPSPQLEGPQQSSPQEQELDFQPRDVTNIPWHARVDSTSMSLHSQTTLSSSPISSNHSPSASRHDPAIRNSWSADSHGHYLSGITALNSRPRTNSSLTDYDPFNDHNGTDSQLSRNSETHTSWYPPAKVPPSTLFQKMRNIFENQNNGPVPATSGRDSPRGSPKRTRPLSLYTIPAKRSSVGSMYTKEDDPTSHLLPDHTDPRSPNEQSSLLRDGLEMN